MVNTDEIMREIESGRYPKHPLVPLTKPFKNDAGSIQNLAWATFGSASSIYSNAGAIRSNHYHRTDWHFIYVISGLMQYYWRPARCPVTPEKLRCPPGSIVFTPPNVEHATFFPIGSVVVTFNRNARDHANHEADLVRVQPLIGSSMCPAVSHGVKCSLPWQVVEERDFRTPYHDGQHEDIDGRRFSF
jgi:hypothetical protein